MLNGLAAALRLLGQIIDIGKFVLSVGIVLLSEQLPLALMPKECCYGD
jgi:hypothetical protein